MSCRRQNGPICLGLSALPDCCEALGIRDAVDRMIVLDYLIVNGDRHQNNFGVVRNADTLEYLGAAPIYDSGTSL